MFRVGASAEGFEFGQSGVSAGNDGLADIDRAGLVFSEPIQRRVDDASLRGASMEDHEVGFMNFPTLLHFTQKGGAFFPSADEKKA